MDLFAELLQRQVDYSQLATRCHFMRRPHAYAGKMDVSVIIPVHGRTEYHKTISDHFRDAVNACGEKKIALTFVEHDNSFQHPGLVDTWVNYIGIPRNDEPFNKALCHNMGALYGPASEYLLFHDSDIPAPPDFFIKIFQNLRDNDALQAFSKRRLWQVDEHFTKKMFIGEKFYGYVPFASRHVRELEGGASGGSIFVKRDLFEKTGGFDPEFFTEYSIEDQVFFDKMQECGHVGFCDDPAIDLLHLWHPDSFNKTTKEYDWDIYHDLVNLSGNDKDRFYRIKRKHMRLHAAGYYNEFREVAQAWTKEIERFENDPDYPRKAYLDLTTIFKTKIMDMGHCIIPCLINQLVVDPEGPWDGMLEDITGCTIIPCVNSFPRSKLAHLWRTWYDKIYLA